MSGTSPTTCVEADAGEADLGLGAPPGVAEQDDLLAGPDDVAGVLGEAAVEADVDRARAGDRTRRTRAPGCRGARRPARARRAASSIVSAAGGSWSSSSVALAAVGVGGEREVERRDALALGDGLDELRPRSSGASA